MWHRVVVRRSSRTTEGKKGEMHIVEVGLHSSGGSSDCIVGLFLSAPNQPNLLRINSGVEGFWIIFLRLKLRRKKQVFQEEYFKRSRSSCRNMKNECSILGRPPSGEMETETVPGMRGGRTWLSCSPPTTGTIYVPRGGGLERQQSRGFRVRNHQHPGGI